MSLTIQNNFPVTNQYLNNIATKDCNLKSLTAKVSIVVFPLFALIVFFTCLIDLISTSCKSKEEQVLELVIDFSENIKKIQNLIANASPTQFAQLIADPRVQAFKTTFLNSLHPNHQAPDLPAIANAPLRVLRNEAKIKQLLADMIGNVGYEKINLVAKRACKCSAEEFGSLIQDHALKNHRESLVELIDIDGLPLETDGQRTRALAIKQLLAGMIGNVGYEKINLVAKRACKCSAEEFGSLIQDHALKNHRADLIKLIIITH